MSKTNRALQHKGKEAPDLRRLVRLLKRLSKSERETLAILLDDEASRVMEASRRERKRGVGIPIEQW